MFCARLVTVVWHAMDANSLRVVLQAGGGMATADGSGRRRSPGGVFFLLLKDRVSKDDYKMVSEH